MDDRIPLIEPVVGEEELSNVRMVLESGYMTQGPYAAEFETSFSEMVGANHGVTATSCTTGLEMVLDALEIGPGDEVLLPDFTHPATANAVVRVGAKPVLIDVDRETYNIDLNELRSSITDRTRALLPVSWGGQPLPTESLTAIASDHNLPIVEDAACSAGASYGGKPVGSQFDVSVFSFHPRKVLTMGEGGIVTTDNDDLVEAMRRIKNFGTNPHQGDVGFERADATNFRLSDVLAAIGVAQLKKIEGIIERRRELAGCYTELLKDVQGIAPPNQPAAAKHTFQSYCVYVEAGDDGFRDDLIDAMADRNIETQIGTYSLHMTEAFGDANRVGPLTVSRDLYHNLLTLPIAHTMTEADQRRVINALDEAINRHL